MDKAKGKDHHKVCWSCGKATMVSKGNYSQCTSCGATYNDIPESGPPAFKGEGYAVSAGSPR